MQQPERFLLDRKFETEGLVRNPNLIERLDFTEDWETNKIFQAGYQTGMLFDWEAPTYLVNMPDGYFNTYTRQIYLKKFEELGVKSLTLFSCDSYQSYLQRFMHRARHAAADYDKEPWFLLVDLRLLFEITRVTHYENGTLLEFPRVGYTNEYLKSIGKDNYDVIFRRKLYFSVHPDRVGSGYYDRNNEYVSVENECADTYADIDIDFGFDFKK